MQKEKLMSRAFIAASRMRFREAPAFSIAPWGMQNGSVMLPFCASGFLIGKQ
jgi:hypothetical protein